MTFENRRSTVHPAEATATDSSSAAINQAKVNRRRSIFTKLVKRSSSSVDRPEPSFVIARSDQPISALFSPTRQVHSMGEDSFKHLINVKSKDENEDYSGFEGDDSDFRPPAFLLEQLKEEHQAQVAAQKRRHSVCASSQRLQAQRMLEKMEKIRAFDDLIQSGKTKTIRLSITPKLVV